MFVYETRDGTQVSACDIGTLPLNCSFSPRIRFGKKVVTSHCPPCEWLGSNSAQTLVTGENSSCLEVNLAVISVGQRATGLGPGLGKRCLLCINPRTFTRLQEGASTLTWFCNLGVPVPLLSPNPGN